MTVREIVAAIDHQKKPWHSNPLLAEQCIAICRRCFLDAFVERLEGLERELRKPSVGISSVGMNDEPPRVEEYYDASRISCADAIRSAMRGDK